MRHIACHIFLCGQTMITLTFLEEELLVIKHVFETACPYHKEVNCSIYFSRFTIRNAHLHHCHIIHIEKEIVYHTKNWIIAWKYFIIYKLLIRLWWYFIMLTMLKINILLFLLKVYFLLLFWLLVIVPNWIIINNTKIKTSLYFSI